MKIMFVDDEPRILQGIERIMYGLSDKWDMSFFEHGEAALATIKQDPVDVIITDLRMPGMDGATLLQETQKHFPDIVRIVLSGHAELETTLRTIPIAHQYLAKPCKADTLKYVVESTYNLRTLLNDKAMRRIVGNINMLPSVPRIYAELMKALASDETDIKDVAGIISQDVAMSAKVLQLVNSAFFNQAATISTIEQAVARLGLQMVKNLALTTEIFRDSESTRVARGFSIEAAQSHALHTATLAKKLIRDKALSEYAFMAGMLHDVGKLILAHELPEKFEAVQSLAAAEQLSLYAAEKQLFGVTHAEIGGYMLGIWGLPYQIIEAVVNHHEPTRVPGQTEFGVLEAVYVANCLVDEAKIDVGYLEEMGVQNQLETWREMATRLMAA